MSVAARAPWRSGPRRSVIGSTTHPMRVLDRQAAWAYPRGHRARGPGIVDHLVRLESSGRGLPSACRRGWAAMGRSFWCLEPRLRAGLRLLHSNTTSSSRVERPRQRADPRCSVVGATTGWSRSWAGLPHPVSGSASGIERTLLTLRRRERRCSLAPRRGSSTSFVVDVTRGEPHAPLTSHGRCSRSAGLRADRAFDGKGSGPLADEGGRPLRARRRPSSAVGQGGRGRHGGVGPLRRSVRQPSKEARAPRDRGGRATWKKLLEDSWRNGRSRARAGHRAKASWVLRTTYYAASFRLRRCPDWPGLGVRLGQPRRREHGEHLRVR